MCPVTPILSPMGAREKIRWRGGGIKWKEVEGNERAVASDGQEAVSCEADPPWKRVASNGGGGAERESGTGP